MPEFNGKVALVTGSARGIGREIAARLAREGAETVMSDVVDEGATAEAVEALRSAGLKARYIKLNVADAGEVDAALEGIVKESGKLDLLVNNAGITRDALVVRMKDEDWDSVLAVNLKGCFNCTRAALRIMMKQRSGSIVNVASLSGVAGNPGQANYSASKAGVIGLTMTTAKEMASRGIRVNAVAPGLIDTDMTRKIPEEMRKGMMEQIPLRRMGTAAEVAEAVLFLLSDRASYVTGQVLGVNGGMYT
jgi:3-oxoacyl-[acyl-carrier protein] reductase